MTGLAIPEIDERPVPVVEDDTLKKLIKACQGKDFDSRRDEAMIRFLVDCGVRISELCGLLLDRVDLDAETALVRGKGGKERAVFFGARTARALDRYLRLRRQHRWAHLPEVFLSQRGALTTDGARYRLETLADRAGVPHLQSPSVSAHQRARLARQRWSGARPQAPEGWSSDVMLEKYGRSAADARARQAAQRMRRGDRV
jgi:site-specific recombinase XerD